MKSFVLSIEEKIYSGGAVDAAEALQLYTEVPLAELLNSAGRIRKRYLASKSNFCSIINARSGRCSEDCRYCAQSVHYTTGSEVYPFLPYDKILATAKENEDAGVHRFSIVTSGKSPDDREFDVMLETIANLKRDTTMSICASLGCLDEQRARALKAAGLERYHHNLETSRRYYAEICTTHTFDDRIDTVKNAAAAGLAICSGGIFGLGEAIEDRIDMLLTIRELGVKDIPLNLLTPVPGTPLEKQPIIETEEALRSIALARFINHDASIRIAGGRINLGGAVRDALRGGVDSLMTGNYLTTAGYTAESDTAMMRELGCEL